MQNALNILLTLVGRLALVAVFAGAAVQKLSGFENVVNYMSSHYVPEPKIALVGAIVLLIAGSASILLGYRAKLGAVMLFVFLAAATYYFHPFWKDPGEQIHFMKNLSIAGALLFIMANGSGPASLKKD